MSNEIIQALNKIAQESADISEKADNLAQKSFRLSKVSRFSTLLFVVLSGLLSLRNASEPDNSYSYTAMTFAFVAGAIKVLDSIYAFDRKGALMAAISTQMRHINNNIRNFTIGLNAKEEQQDHLLRIISLFNQEINSTRSLIYHSDVVGNDSSIMMTEQAKQALRDEGIVVVTSTPAAKEEKKEETK
jgi:hypothetical protein